MKNAVTLNAEQFKYTSSISQQCVTYVTYGKWLTSCLTNRWAEKFSPHLGASASTNRIPSHCTSRPDGQAAIGHNGKVGGTPGFCKILAAIFTKCCVRHVRGRSRKKRRKQTQYSPSAVSHQGVCETAGDVNKAAVSKLCWDSVKHDWGYHVCC